MPALPSGKAGVQPCGCAAPEDARARLWPGWARRCRGRAKHPAACRALGAASGERAQRRNLWFPYRCWSHPSPVVPGRGEGGVIAEAIYWSCAVPSPGFSSSHYSRCPSPPCPLPHSLIALLRRVRCQAAQAGVLFSSCAVPSWCRTRWKSCEPFWEG